MRHFKLSAVEVVTMLKAANTAAGGNPQADIKDLSVSPDALNNFQTNLEKQINVALTQNKPGEAMAL